jgi:hypothetical protein
MRMALHEAVPALQLKRRCTSMRRALPIACSAIILLFGGCHKKSRVSAPAPAVTVAPPLIISPPAIIPPELPPTGSPPEIVPAPEPATPPSTFEVGETNFEKGRYAEAAKAFEAYLKSNPKFINRDRALFHLAMSRALASDSNRDLRQAELAFKRLLAEFPSSPYTSQAKFILGLQAQIDRLKTDVKDREERLKRLTEELQRLTEELQKLKEIDMQRKPSRPP